jgi:hypothetical protein
MKNIKFINVIQAKEIHKYRNIKNKLHKIVHLSDKTKIKYHFVIYSITVFAQEGVSIFYISLIKMW